MKYNGKIFIPGKIKLKKGSTGGGGSFSKKISIQDMIERISKKFQITDEEALYIKEVTEEKMHDEKIRTIIAVHNEDTFFLKRTYVGQLYSSIYQTYDEHGHRDELYDPKYIEPGAIFDTMALTVIQYGLQAAGIA